MKNIIAKSLGGLNGQYYFRQLFFGGAFSLLYILLLSQNDQTSSSFAQDIFLYGYLFVSAFLYPYSRFVYESIVSFIMGDNVFFANAIIVLMVKIITMAICWSMAILIAPLGLIYLYIYHSRTQNID